MAIRSRIPVTGGRSWTILPPERNVRWTSGCASAIRENVSATCPASVVSDFRNVRRTGMLKKRLRTSMTVPVGQPQLLIGPAIPASISDFRSLGRVGLARLAADPGDLGNRRQRLAAEPERADPAQVLNVRQLAGRVGLKRQGQVVGGHPHAVVGDPDQIFAPALDAHVNPRRTRVDGVFEQLLDHARRPLHHLARGDLVHDRLRQLTDHSHPTCLPGSLADSPLILPC